MKMIKKSIYVVALTVFSMLGVTSCVNDLDVTPIDPNIQTDKTVYVNLESYQSVIAKVYAGFATTGQQGPAGNPDVGGVDEGFSGYVRMLWNLQELPTDEAICAWGDFGIPQLNFMSYSEQNPFVEGLYYRIYHQIALANEFLRQTTEAKLNERGHGSFKSDIDEYRAEARFIRAFAYWHALDLFGNVPFVLENLDVGVTLPEQIKRADLFTWLETEIKEVEGLLKDANTSTYGRIDKGAAWMLLARLYLNAEVYTGTAKWADVITYTDLINAAYTFDTGSFEDLFMASNNEKDFIFAVPYDGDHMQTYGGTHFIIHSATGGDMNAAAVGINGGWGGNRTIREAYNQFETGDLRGMTGNSNNPVGMFFDSGSLDVDNPGQFTDGFGVTKFKNVDPSNSSLRKDWVSTDFPMMRLAESYLMYAEAYVRGNVGNSSTALDLINTIRRRAYNGTDGDVTPSTLTEDFILAERGRELFWECHRRSDLIRFGKYVSSDYLWQWKGGSENGSAVNASKRLYPIPAKDMGANPNLKQNTGY